MENYKYLGCCEKKIRCACGDGCTCNNKCGVLVFESSATNAPIYFAGDNISKIPIIHGCKTVKMTPYKIVTYLNAEFEANIPTDPDSLRNISLDASELFDLCEKKVVGTLVNVFGPARFPPECNTASNCPVGGVNVVLYSWNYVSLNDDKELLFKTLPSTNPALIGSTEEIRPRIAPIEVRFTDINACTSVYQKYTHQSITYSELIASYGFRKNLSATYQSRASLDLTNYINPPQGGRTITFDTVIIIKLIFEKQ